MWFDLLWVIFILLLLLPVVYLVTKLYAQKSWGKQTSRIKSLGVFPLGTGKYLYLIEAEGVEYLIGVTAKEIKMLAKVGEKSSTPFNLDKREGVDR